MLGVQLLTYIQRARIIINSYPLFSSITKIAGALGLESKQWHWGVQQSASQQAAPR